MFLIEGEIVLAIAATPTLETVMALGLQPVLEHRLDNCHDRSGPGLSLEEIQIRYEPGMIVWLQAPAAGPHGGDSLLDVQ